MRILRMHENYVFLSKNALNSELGFGLSAPREITLIKEFLVPTRGCPGLGRFSIHPTVGETLRVTDAEKST